MRLWFQGGTGSLSSWAFTSKRQLGGEVWRQTEPVPVPLLSPRKGEPVLIQKASRVSALLVLFPIVSACPMAYRSRSLDRYCSLLWDVVHDVPPELLGSLLHEELAEQRDRMQFSEAATGGALAFVPFSQGEGCLLYPRGPGMDRLSILLCSFRSKFRPYLRSAMLPEVQLTVSCRPAGCVAVRTDHVCGVWGMREQEEPRLLQVVGTRAAASCVSVSPHILGEVLVASESGAANLWTVGRGMQEVRTEESNLYFNAKSSWRWCEFSAHPRVMLYADRTGVELTDFRSNPCHTLFRISSTSDCQSGERLLLVRFLGDVHPFHHLLTTQHSAYIMDERFPGVPMLKWDHMMEAPPLFCHVAPGSASGTTKVLLGSQSSQEITLLQYSGELAGGSSRLWSAFVFPARLPDQVPAFVAVGNEADWSAPSVLSSATRHAWRRWLQKLRRREGKPGAPPHLAVRTAGLLSVAEPGAAGRHMQGALQQDLQRCMRTRSLLLNRDLDPVPVPPVVDAEAWCDPLSDRLTAAWRGGTEAWLEWWQEERGENRAMKKEALRRRRRREKEAQRAAGSHLRLSGSFTSSISYQTDVDDFSGWSSGTSGPLSDSQRSRPLGRLAAFLEGQDDSPPPDRLDPPSRTPEPQTANQRSCKLADQSLSSLWETQVGMMLPPPGFRRVGRNICSSIYMISFSSNYHQ
uniref:Uncharacterized protein n=1 Tax=Xiphophorus couchianus TaxID=32473 RepID=A0A3B5LGT5_9TELE